MNWADLEFEGYRDGREWQPWESMLHWLNVAVHKQHYRSPVPEGKLTACLQPCTRCIESQYVFNVVGVKGDFCRAPIDWDCPWKSPSQVPALSPMKTKGGGQGRSRPVAEGKTNSIAQWLQNTLADIHASCESEQLAHAAIVQLGLDEPTTMQELELLGNELIRRLRQEKPWEFEQKVLAERC